MVPREEGIMEEAALSNLMEKKRPDSLKVPVLKGLVEAETCGNAFNAGSKTM